MCATTARGSYLAEAMRLETERVVARGAGCPVQGATARGETIPRPIRDEEINEGCVTASTGVLQRETDVFH